MERERYLKEKIILFYSDLKESGQRFEREIFQGKQNIILFYSDVKGFHRDISTKDSQLHGMNYWQRLERLAMHSEQEILERY